MHRLSGHVRALLAIFPPPSIHQVIHRKCVHNSRKQVVMLNESVDELLTTLRKDAIPLVDAFGFSDYQLNSSLGRYDGSPLLAASRVAKNKNN